MIGSAIAGAIGGLANVGLSIWDRVENQKLNKENLQLQKDKFEYDKQLQQQIFQREDSAVQRNVKDKLQAGINPLLDAQQAGAGSVVQTTAPQGMRAGTEGIQQALDNALNNMNTLATSAMERARIKSEISKNLAEEANIRESTLTEPTKRDVNNSIAEKNRAETDTTRHNLNQSIDQDIRTNDILHQYYVLGKIADKKYLDGALSRTLKSRGKAMKNMLDIYNKPQDILNNLFDYVKNNVFKGGIQRKEDKETRHWNNYNRTTGTPAQRWGGWYR